jgi:DNA-binding PadR family transcriptional regulator
MHPYAIRQEIIELTGRIVWPSHSSLRRALDSLIKTGLIEESSSNAHYWLKATRSVPYEITEAGYKTVRRELSMYHEVFVKSRHWLEMV